METTNTNQPKHTQGEWRANGKKIECYNKMGKKLLTLNQVKPAHTIDNLEVNAHHIVKCMNMHDELVAVLEKMATRMADLLDKQAGIPVEDYEVAYAFKLIKQAM